MRAPTVALRLDELGDLQHMTQALVLDDGTLVYLAEFVVGGKGRAVPSTLGSMRPSG